MNNKSLLLVTIIIFTALLHARLHGIQSTEASIPREDALAIIDHEQGRSTGAGFGLGLVVGTPLGFKFASQHPELALASCAIISSRLNRDPFEKPAWYEETIDKQKLLVTLKDSKNEALTHSGIMGLIIGTGAGYCMKTNQPIRGFVLVPWLLAYGILVYKTLTLPGWDTEEYRQLAALRRSEKASAQPQELDTTKIQQLAQLPER